MREAPPEQEPIIQWSTIVNQGQKMMLDNKISRVVEIVGLHMVILYHQLDKYDCESGTL